MKLVRISIAILASFMLIGLLSPAVQADDSKAEVELKVEIVSPLSVTTKEATGISARRATLNGSLTSLGTASSADVSFGWDTEPCAEDAYTNWTLPVVKTRTGAFKAHITDLTPGETYYFRAVAVGDDTIVYGDEMTFTTKTRGRWWNKVWEWLFPWLGG